MNKIFKSGGRWQVLKKRVSPAVIAFQALTATACVLLTVMLLKYRSESAATPVQKFRRTAFSGANPGGIIRLSNTLDPASFTRERPDQVSKFALADMVKITMPRPELRSSGITIPEFTKLPTTEIGYFADLRIQPAGEKTEKIPAASAVMYDENGREIARWRISNAPEKAATVFRIDGNGKFQYTAVTASCGDHTMDQYALNRALSLRLVPGVYSVWYPQNKKREM